MTRTVVIGIGNPLRGDDAAGVAVAERLRPRVPEGVEVVSCRLVLRRCVDPSRMADTSGRAPGSGSEGGHLRDGRREGRVKDVACADARCAWKEPRGCARTANDRV